MQNNPLANVRFDQTTGVVCEKCKGNIFGEALLLRRVSKFLVASSSDKDQIIPVPTFYCVQCKHVNKDFLPGGLENDTNENDSVVNY